MAQDTTDFDVQDNTNNEQDINVEALDNNQVEAESVGQLYLQGNANKSIEMMIEVNNGAEQAEDEVQGTNDIKEIKASDAFATFAKGKQRMT